MLKDIVQKLRSLTPERIEEIALKAMRDNEARIVDLNTQQMLQGVDSKNQFISPPYRSDKYAEFKLTLNPAGVVDLKLTGAFQDGMFLQANKFPAYIFSSDEKTRQLVGKYGIDIFGLDQTSMAEVAKDIVEPEIQTAIREAVRL